MKTYLPGNQHIPPWEKENHLQNAIFGGYVSSLEGIQDGKNNTSLPGRQMFGRLLLDEWVWIGPESLHGDLRNEVEGRPWVGRLDLVMMNSVMSIGACVEDDDDDDDDDAVFKCAHVVFLWHNTKGSMHASTCRHGGGLFRHRTFFGIIWPYIIVHVFNDIGRYARYTYAHTHVWTGECNLQHQQILKTLMDRRGILLKYWWILYGSYWGLGLKPWHTDMHFVSSGIIHVCHCLSM